MPLKNKIFVGLLVAFCTFAHAAITKTLSLNYSGTSVSFDYNNAPWKNEFIGIDISRCENTSACTLYLNSQKSPSNIGIVSGEGLHFIEFYIPEERFFGDKIDKAVIYSQYVAILPLSTTLISDTAKKFSPKFSFHNNESYFPVSISELFNRPYGDMEDGKLQGVNEPIDTADSVFNLLAYNGASENKIRIKPNIAKSINGNKQNFPIYWFHQAAGDDLWITYFVLYAYDEKKDEYLAGGFGAETGSHSIDRESITVKFTKTNDIYSPQQVIYAGHLESQPTKFLGCASDSNCSSGGALSARWEGGKTTVNWENSSRIGNSPIVYVAHGSHASTPAYGWYFLETGATGFVSNVTEPAGNSVSENISSGELISVNFENSYFQPLTYSGYLIKGAGFRNNWYRIFPFVRFPIEKWANTSNSIFNDCVSSKQGCEKYVNLQAQPTQSLQAFISTLETTPVNLAGIAVSGSDIYVASLTKDLSQVISNYDNTPFYKSSILVTKISDKDIKWQKTIATDFYTANETGNLWQTNIGFSADGTKLVVAASSYTGSGYSMSGGKFLISLSSPDTQSYTSLYTSDNLGWFPYFSNGQLNHFSYGGYYGCIENSCNRSIDPNAFATESHNKILQAIGLTGNLTAPMSGLRATMISRLKQLAGV